MDRVEHAVVHVVGIEQDVGQADGEVALEGEFREQAGPPAGAVEVEVRREGLRVFVEDVERTVEIVDEESPAARLVPQEVHPRQLSPGVLPGELAGDWHLRILGKLERHCGR